MCYDLLNVSLLLFLRGAVGPSKLHFEHHTLALSMTYEIRS